MLLGIRRPLAMCPSTAPVSFDIRSHFALDSQPSVHSPVYAQLTAPLAEQTVVRNPLKAALSGQLHSPNSSAFVT